MVWFQVLILVVNIAGTVLCGRNACLWFWDVTHPAESPYPETETRWKFLASVGGTFLGCFGVALSIYNL